MTLPSGKHDPIERSVLVDCPIDEAFRLFTGQFAAWWPLATHSVSGEEAESCEFEPWPGGRVFERTRSGREHEWGSVIVWEPPARVEFTWHPGAGRDHRQRVGIEFKTEGEGTRVTLTHRGWRASGITTCALARFQAFASHCALAAA